MARIDIKQSAMIAAVVTAASLLVNYLMGLIKVVEVTPLFSSVKVVNPITGTIGQKMLGLMSGVIPIDNLWGFGLITTFISALVIVMVGTYAIDAWRLPTFKGFAGVNGNQGRLASVIFWGSVPAYLVLVGFVAPGIWTVVGLTVYLIALAMVAVWGAKLLNLKI